MTLTLTHDYLALADRSHDTALAMLAAIVEADAAALEASDLVGLGVITHARYEQAAQSRDAAIDRAAEWLRLD